MKLVVHEKNLISVFAIIFLYDVVLRSKRASATECFKDSKNLDTFRSGCMSTLHGIGKKTFLGLLSFSIIQKILS